MTSDPTATAAQHARHGGNCPTCSAEANYVTPCQLPAATAHRRCAYCETVAVPGLPNHNGWPVCADHTTPEDLMETHDLIGELTDAERLELDRLRKFVRRIAYVRSHMAAGDQAIMDALTDDRYAAVLAGLDRV